MKQLRVQFISLKCSFEITHVSLSAGKILWTEFYICRVQFNVNSNVHSKLCLKFFDCVLYHYCLDCPFPPPNVPHAIIDKTKQVGYKKGGKAYYRCVDGYTSEQAEPYKLCDKDPMTQGFIWSGNFTCKSK